MDEYVRAAVHLLVCLRGYMYPWVGIDDCLDELQAQLFCAQTIDLKAVGGYAGEGLGIIKVIAQWV